MRHNPFVGAEQIIESVNGSQRLKSFKDGKERMDSILSVSNNETSLEHYVEDFKWKKANSKTEDSVDWKSSQDIWDNHSSCVDVLTITAEAIFLSKVKFFIPLKNMFRNFTLRKKKSISFSDFTEGEFDHTYNEEILRWYFLCCLLYRQTFND